MKTKLKQSVTAQTKNIVHLNNKAAVVSSRAIAELFRLEHDELLFIYQVAKHRAESDKDEQAISFYKTNLKPPLFGNSYDLTKAAFIHFSEAPQYSGYDPEKRAALIAEFEAFEKQIIITPPITEQLATIEQPQTELATLAIEINLLNEQAEISLKQSLIYAVRTGSKLKQAKEKVGHGNFVRWVNDNCTVSRQYATDYMRLADEYPQLIDTNGNSRLHLPTITQARAMLSAPSDVKTEVIERIENGETVPTAEIKQLKKQAADAIALAEKMNAETAELREKIANNETRLAQAEKAINEKVNDRDEIEAELNALLAEGGVDKLIEQKTATATAKIAELNNDIHFLQTERTAAIERGVQIELNKKAQEVKALDDKLDAKKSALETVESKLKQSKTNAVYNANHQQAAAKLIDLIQATRLLVNTATTPENPIFEHKTIKLMTEAAKDCTALAHLLNDLVLLKQTEIEQLAADH